MRAGTLTMRWALVLSAVAAVLAIGGCTAQEPSAPNVPSVPAPPSPSRSKGPTSASPPPTAADGSDVSACQDGNCEISISAPSEIMIGGTRVSLTKVSAGPVVLRLEGSGGFSQVTAGAGGVVSLNNLRVNVVAVNGTTAVLRISRS